LVPPDETSAGRIRIAERTVQLTALKFIANDIKLSLWRGLAAASGREKRDGQKKGC
jgi:hypothetical protein